MIEVKCDYCGNVFYREYRRINENITRCWRQFCSLDCQYKARTKAKEYKCANPKCNKVFKRAPHEISSSGICFCSNSCAAKINNKRRVEKLPKKYCLNHQCNKVISRRNKFCSNKCQGIVKTISDAVNKKRIIQKIQKFYKIYQRIPMKKEMWGIYKPARKIFGNWNKAIIGAGFKPNPVKFAKKYIANDGHKCDSLAEKIIDDWFTARKIKHLRNVPYKETKYTADFKVDTTLIEFFGLSGELKSYDELMRKKLTIIKERKLKLISIFPKDLFPKSRLNEILRMEELLGRA